MGSGFIVRFCSINLPFDPHWVCKKFLKIVLEETPWELSKFSWSLDSPMKVSVNSIQQQQQIL